MVAEDCVHRKVIFLNFKQGERMTRLWINTLLSLFVASVVVGCGDSRSDRDAGEGDAPKKKEVITEKGSDTMILLAQKWAETFGAKNGNIEVQVTGGGSGTGISALINGTTEIANASRPMKQEERDQIKQKYGNDVVEIPVALDGVTVYINETNTIDALTIEQLRKIYLGEATNWKEFGGPDQKIILYGRENSSGTYEFFKEHVLEKKDFPPQTQTLGGTAAVVNAVAQDKGGVGYGGEAYASGVKKVKLMADGTPIEPTEDAVRSGQYPLSRNLYFYLRSQPTGAVKEYTDWVLSPEGQAVVKEVGYYPIK
jgi:phosphate transport system substrate-binding protein